MGLPGRERSLTISSAASGYNPPTWHTDRRTDNGRQQRPRLRITSRGNEKVNNKELDVLSGEHFINSGWAFQYSNPQLEHINGPWQLTGRNLPSPLCYVTQFLPALCEMVAVKTKKCRRAKWTPQRLYFPQLVTCETCVTLTLSLSTSTGTEPMDVPSPFTFTFSGTVYVYISRISFHAVVGPLYTMRGCGRKHCVHAWRRLNY